MTVKITPNDRGNPPGKLADAELALRETLRRKLVRLEEKDLVQRTSYGFVVKDMAVWRRLGELAGDTEA